MLLNKKNLQDDPECCQWYRTSSWDSYSDSNTITSLIRIWTWISVYKSNHKPILYTFGYLATQSKRSFVHPKTQDSAFRFGGDLDGTRVLFCSVLGSADEDGWGHQSNDVSFAVLICKVYCSIEIFFCHFIQIHICGTHYIIWHP